MMKKNSITSISIDRLSAKGFGVGTVQKTPQSQPTKAMIPCAIPGDEIVAEIGPKRKGSYLGKLLSISAPSSDRIEAVCRHAPVCGGCSLQYLKYEKQLFYKEAKIRELFTSLFSGSIDPILPAPLQWNYRNKMEYSFSQNKAGERFLGLMQAGTRGKVENLFECHLSPSWFLQVLSAVKNWWDSSKIAAFHELQNAGSLRTLTLREGKKTGHKMAMLTVSGNPDYALTKEQMSQFAKCVQEVLPEETSLSIFLRIHQAIRGQPTQFYEILLSGPDHIQEELDIVIGPYQKTYRFKISPTAFFQPNTMQAEKLYSQALAIAGMKKRKCVLDLYAGTATLGMVFAPFAEKVIAIELNPYAVFDAQVNQELNEVQNLQVHQGDVAQVLQDLKLQTPDLIVIDPPRIGLSPQAAEIIASLAPLEILYISCAPKEQARDCLFFKQAGYDIVSIQPVDQFPHTIHIENIILLKKR
ncbi:MAG: 23S rRNA (uracil(1939)-C(5))-methyltransferase RlmD [Rhabdochlamydiaceae bacterium]|nr:23S rRNA (uracil(1939)-C(5))-methyltransferase RlmD [Rhabdochlamydiaceae bacterium]